MGAKHDRRRISSGNYPPMHHFVTEMCTDVHISVTKWCIVGYGTLWDLCDRSIDYHYTVEPSHDTTYHNGYKLEYDYENCMIQIRISIHKRHHMHISGEVWGTFGTRILKKTDRLIEEISCIMVYICTGQPGPPSTDSIRLTRWPLGDLNDILDK